MRLDLEVKDAALAGVLDGAGSRYWCKDLQWPEFEVRAGVASGWEALLAGVIPAVTVIEDRSEEGQPARRHRVTREKIAKAVLVILEKYPHHIEPVLIGYDSPHCDATTGDVLLQCAALGDIVYG